MKIADFFMPPFLKFKWVVYLLCLLGFVYVPDGLVQTFRLNGLADYAFAAQANTQGSMGAIHAMVLFVLHSMLPPFEAALAVGFLLPPVFLAVLFVVAPWMTAGLVAGRRRAFAVVFVVFMPALFSFFAPGSVGAQPYGLLLFAMFLVCLLRPLRGKSAQALWVSGAVIFALAFLWVEPAARALESEPVWSRALFYRQAFLPGLSILASLLLGLTSSKRRRWRFWVLLALQLALAGRAGESVYQLALWQMASVPSLTALFFRLWDRLALWPEGPRKYLSEAGLLLALTVLPVGLVPAALTGKPWVPDVLLAPMVRGVPVCDLKGAAHELLVLNKQFRVLNHPSIGPELALRMPAQIILARDPQGGGALESKAFFEAETDKAALDIVKKLQVDYVFACPEGLPVKEGLFLDRLVHKRVPDWLLPLGVVFDGKTLLYKVVKDQR